VGEDGAQRSVSAMIEAAILVLFAAGIALPMMPGFVELMKKNDAQALSIDQNYTRDPRYMGKSFRQKIKDVLARATLNTPVPFLNRKNEYAVVVPSLTLSDGETLNHVVLSNGPVNAGKHTTLVDMYAQSDVRIGSDSRFRTLAADGDVWLDARVSIARWIDCEKNVHVRDGCSLGHSTSAEGLVDLGHAVRFSRVCGHPIVVGNEAFASGDQPQTKPFAWSSHGHRELIRGGRVINARERVEGDIIATGDIQLGDGSVVTGSIKAHRIIVGANAIVEGNIVARSNVHVGVEAAVRGHVFSEGNIVLGREATVGAKGTQKTLYASGDIRIAEGARVYGWAIAEGSGLTV
jgi:predicted acyltransferase (DUF342 family)